MDFSGFGSLMGGGMMPGGGVLAGLQKLMGGAGGAAAPAVPTDGAMQPTIGPGVAPTAAKPYQMKMGLPQGGLLGLMQGGSPQGLMGLLKHLSTPPPGPIAGAMPQVGMMSGLPGTPGSPMAGPVAPSPPQLPMNINPMDQF